MLQAESTEIGTLQRSPRDSKLNGIDPRAWLADVLARLPGYPASRIHELLPWHWNEAEQISAAA